MKRFTRIRLDASLYCDDLIDCLQKLSRVGKSYSANLLVFIIVSHAVYYEPRYVGRKKSTILLVISIKNDANFLIDSASYWEPKRTESHDNMNIQQFLL